MTEPKIFELGDFPLQSGMPLKNAKLVYQTYGTLAPDRSNVIVYPTSYGAQHTDIEWLIGPGNILDTDRYFVIIPNMFTNGLSTSPSNAAFPYDHGRFPIVTPYDNVTAQQRLLSEALGVDRIALVYGWSMGAQQAYHWGALFPELVDRICAVCGAARTAPHNQIFLDGIVAALTADSAYRDGWFWETPYRGLRAMARVYAGWAVSQRFYREEVWRGLGHASVEEFLVSGWEGNFRRRDANDLLAQFRTWQHCDLAAHPKFNGDLVAALGSIRAKAYLLPCTRDLYFRPADNEWEAQHMPNVEFRPFESLWGHRGGNPIADPTEAARLKETVWELLAS